MDLVFVGGIHGAGKSRMASAYCSSGRHCEYLSAGDVINAGRDESANTDSKVVPNVDSNQDVLISGLRSLRLSADLVLDGHFALWTPSGVSLVPLSVFRALNPAGIVVVTVDATTAAERLQQRDGKAYDPGSLDALQREEISHAVNVAAGLGCPVEQVGSGDQEKFDSIVDSYRCLG